MNKINQEQYDPKNDPGIKELWEYLPKQIKKKITFEDCAIMIDLWEDVLNKRLGLISEDEFKDILERHWRRTQIKNRESEMLYKNDVVVRTYNKECVA